MLELQKENENLKNSSSNELIGYQTEIKQLCEEKSLLEKQIKDVRGSCEDLAVKNKHLELAIQNCKKNEVSRSSPNLIYIETEKTEQDFDCMICFVEE